MHMHAHEATSPLGFTGERVIPDDPKWAWCFQAHLFGYEDLVRRTKQGGMVLDCGCGEGYGASVLAKHALHVVTFDVSFEAVQHAQQRYGDSSISWLVADAQHLPFKDEAFDVTSSLQVIEHFPDTDAHLRDVARVTKSGGLHYVTTPNISMMGEAEKDNPFHVRDFDAEDLEASLRRYFSDAQVEGMFYVETSKRYQRLKVAESKEESMRPKVERVEKLLSRLPGAIRSRIRPMLRKLAGVSEWPLQEADDARNAIIAQDFYAGEPASESFCLIGVAVKR